MNSLIQQIQKLSSSSAIESAKIVASSIADEPIMTDTEFKKEFGNPVSHINDMDHFARLLLINAAESPRYKDLVEKAIENSGQKQLILGGTEIVALAAIGLAALRIIVNPPSSRHFKYTDKDGNKTEFKEEFNNDTNFISRLLSKIYTK